jgi:hypothetical protein
MSITEGLRAFWKQRTTMRRSNCHQFGRDPHDKSLYIEVSLPKPRHGIYLNYFEVNLSPKIYGDGMSLYCMMCGTTA